MKTSYSDVLYIYMQNLNRDFGVEMCLGMDCSFALLTRLTFYKRQLFRKGAGGNVDFVS